jgi:hypothetical protein
VVELQTVWQRYHFLPAFAAKRFQFFVSVDWPQKQQFDRLPE